MGRGCPRQSATSMGHRCAGDATVSGLRGGRSGPWSRTSKFGDGGAGGDGPSVSLGPDRGTPFHCLIMVWTIGCPLMGPVATVGFQVSNGRSARFCHSALRCPGRWPRPMQATPRTAPMPVEVMKTTRLDQGLQFRQNIAEISEISSFSLRSDFFFLYRSKFFGEIHLSL